MKSIKHTKAERERWEKLLKHFKLVHTNMKRGNRSKEVIDAWSRAITITHLHMREDLPWKWLRVEGRSKKLIKNLR